MWIIIAIIVVVVIIVAMSRSSSGGTASGPQSLDSNKVRNMIDSTGDILSASRNLQDAYPQMRPFVAKLDTMHAVLCSYPRPEFMNDMRGALQEVVPAGEAVASTLPSEAQGALMEYIDSCRHFLSLYGNVATQAVHIATDGTVGTQARHDVGTGDFEGLSFETQFGQLCALLGCHENVITSAMGMPDHTFTNDDGTRFLFYERCKSIVTIPSDVNVAKYLSAPCKDAKGYPLDASDGLWEIRRVKVGDTRSAVQEAWGPPSDQGRFALVYGNSSWQTKNKVQYVIALVFDREKDVLSEFKARLEDTSR